MKFKDGISTREFTLAEFLERELDGSDYERGSVETAQATANKVAEAFSRLVQLMVERKELNRAEVYTVITGYKNE